MPLMPVFLWTDTLVFLLIALGLGFAFHVTRHEHLRAPWRRVVRSRIGVATLVVLSAYGLVGLLDTVHFRLKLDQPLAEAGHRTRSQGTRPRC